MRGGLYKAAMSGDTKTVLNILAEAENIEIFRETAGNALICAAWKRHLNTVSALVDIGADVNHQNQAGQTALMYAARWNSTDIVEFLLAHGADPKIEDDNQKTASDYAIEGGYKDMANRLKPV